MSNKPMGHDGEEKRDFIFASFSHKILMPKEAPFPKMDLNDSLVFIICFISVGILSYYRRKIYHLPPGPKGLPFIGNAWQIDSVKAFLDLTALGTKHGDIFKIKMYGKDIIVLSGYELLHQALVTDSLSFAGRPRNIRVELLKANGFHVTFSDYSERVKILKKSLLSCMRMYGNGLERLEDLVSEMMMELLEKCQKTKGQPHNFEAEFFNFMMNVIVSLGCGSCLSRKDIDEFVEAEKYVLQVLTAGSTSMILDQLPWLKHFPLDIIRYANIYVEKMKNIFDHLIEERKESFDGKNMECLVDAMQKSNRGLNHDEQFKMEDIRAVMIEICGAGIATSTATLSYFLAQCIVKPEILKKIQAEIDINIGLRAPKLEDKKNMPYMEAAFLETLRLSSIVPILLPHKTTADVEIGGYEIPKNTEVWMNTWALHHDERYWDEPWSFKPERFLAPDGNVVPPDHINRKRLLPFGAGRRVCIGETMAKGRLFLLITTILQQFTLLPESEDKLPDTDPRHQIPSLVIFPKPYKMRMIPRV